MKKTKLFYLIEPLDIDGDKNNDGFLISQYKLDKDNHKIFTKNKYVTFKNFKSYVSEFKKKGGSLNHYNQQHMMHYNYPNYPNNQQIAMMNNKAFNHQMNYNGYPPQVIVKDHHNSSFGSNFMNGLGGGIGVGVGFGITEGLMDGLFGF